MYWFTFTLHYYITSHILNYTYTAQIRCVSPSGIMPHLLQKHNKWLLEFYLVQLSIEYKYNIAILGLCPTLHLFMHVINWQTCHKFIWNHYYSWDWFCLRLWWLLQFADLHWKVYNKKQELKLCLFSHSLPHPNFWSNFKILLLK